ncbi:hypothetical protein MRX96_000201 [Rhipicephalus microplus]
MASTENTRFCQPFPVQPPTSFDFDKVSEWTAWVRDFDDYRFASGLSERTGEAQVCTLMYRMGRHARNIFWTFGLSEEQSKDYEVVKKRFDAYFDATRNSVYESACFHRRHRAAGELVDQYVTTLHTLADRCNYGVVKARTILDRFVFGLRDSKLFEALQINATLNLKTALSREERKKRYKNNNMSFAAVRNTKQPALRSTQFIEKLAGGQSANGSIKASESVRRVAEPVIESHRVLQKEQSATGANDGDTSLQCAHKGRTSRTPKQVHPR